MIAEHVIALSFLLNSCLSLVCTQDNCYGTMGELQDTHRQEERIVYYLKPCNYIEPCAPIDCLSLLMAGSKLDCKGNLSSISNESEPWIIRGNITLVPSCKRPQTLIRSGTPSEDVSSLDSISLSKVVIQDKQTPCAVIMIQDSDVSLQDLNLDNTGCVSHMSESMKKTYLSSLINVYPRRRHISYVTIQSVHTSGGLVAIHMGSLSKRFPMLMLSNVRIENIIGGSLYTELVCGQIEVTNVSKWMVLDIPALFCPNNSEVNHGDRISDMMGPLQLSYFHSSMTESSHSNGNCIRCYLILAIALLITLMVMTLSCLCYFSTHSNVGPMIEAGDLMMHVQDLGHAPRQMKRRPWSKKPEP